MTNITRLIKPPIPVKVKKMNDGFILFYRSIQEQDWYNADIPKTMLFNYCLLNASHTIYESAFRGKTLLLEAGQLHSTYKKIAEESGILRLYGQYVKSKDPLSSSKKAINKSLEAFTKEGTLSYYVEGNGRLQSTVITISNWAKFQALPVTKPVTQLVTKDSLVHKGLESSAVTKLVTEKVTKNNNTLSKDRVDPMLTNKFSTEDLTAAEYIFSKVIQLKPNFKKPNINSWADQVRLMREQDKKNHREICELFKWANKDSFWQANILSPKKLRSQWDELEIKSKATPSTKNTKTLDPNDTSWADGFKVTL
jgi:hypothetical protein